MIAPALLLILAGVIDISRVVVVWQELDNAATTIVQTAEKLSVSPTSPQTSLTPTQMQTALTSIYAEIPGLSGGAGSGAYSGPFAATLSEIVFLPLCPFTAGCTPDTPLATLCGSTYNPNGDLCSGSPKGQTAYTLWSTYLTTSSGGTQLNQTSTAAHPLLRPCSTPLSSVASFPNNSTQLQVMLDPTKLSGSVSMLLIPQLVADVEYTYTPLFPFYFGTITLRVSAVMPTPRGGTDQLVTFSGTPTTAAVSCTLPT